MSDLTVPKDWIKINIAEIADVDLGKTPKKKDYKNDGFYKVIKFRDVGYEGIDWSKNKDGFVPKDATKDLRKLEIHDVLITASAHSSEHIGRKICFVNRIPNDYKDIFYCGELLGIRADKDALNPKFVFLYFLSHDGYKEVQSHVKGVHLTSGQARNMIVPFAAYEEQKDVISIIEQLFSDLDNAVDNLQKAKDQLKIYRQSVLEYVFEGKLTGLDQKMFNTYKISEIFDVGTGATPKRGTKKYYDNGNIPWATSGNVNENVIRFTKERITKKAIEETNCKIFPKGSLVVAMYGEGKTRGKVSELGIDAATNQACAVLVFSDNLKVSKEYTKIYLKSEYESMRRRASGGVQPNLNLGIIKKWQIHAPKERKEQDKIVQEIESRFSVCDKMEETINNSLEQAEALRQSILKQAFEGELTEAWRKDHPDLISGENSAKALLERIKKEREAQKNTKKRKK